METESGLDIRDTSVKTPAAPRTLKGRVLPGWMRRENAVRFLLEECRNEAGFSVRDAEDIWQLFRSRVDELPERPATAPRSAALCSADWKTARQFRNRYEEAREILEFVRVNPLDLQIHQLHVCTEDFGYAEQLGRDGWVRTALLNGNRGHQIRWRVEPGRIVFELPHGEFTLVGPIMPDARLQVRPLSSFVSVAEFRGRMVLSNGYHRTLAWLDSRRGQRESSGENTVDEESTLLFPVTSTLPFSNQSEEQIDEILFARRAPLFGDFFNDRLALPVRLRRRKGYEMRVRVEMAAIDEEVEPEEA